MQARQNILCVDDDEVQLELYRRLLGRRYQLYLARSYEQAMEKVELGPDFAAVLAPASLPKQMDGIDFLRLMHRAAPLCSRIMVSGPGDHFDAVRAVRQGGIHHLLKKPCVAWKLERAVEVAVLKHLESQPAYFSQGSISAPLASNAMAFAA